MNLLQHHLVLALDQAADSALGRCLASLGASVMRLDVSQLAEWLPRASFLLDRHGLPALAELGWDRKRIQALAPELVHVSVTPFGSDAPRRGWRGGELVAAAMGGVLRLNGTPQRPPVKEALQACTFHADMVAFTGAMAAHYARMPRQRGEHVDVSIQEVAFSRQFNGVLVWQFDRRKLHRVGGALNYGLATVRCIWPLRDGWCFHTLMTGRFGAPANQALSNWMDVVGADNPLRGTDWISYNRSTLDPEIRQRWEAAIAAFFATRSKAELLDEGRRRGINAAVVAEPKDVLADPHLQAREFWQTRGALKVPTRFMTVHQPVPTALPPERRASARRGPLAGVRVLDFSWALVGSITTKTLGDLGAEVIKVESRTRPCLTRLDVQVSVSKAGNFDDKPWFAHLNTSKRSLALDMKRPESRELLEPLIRWADVVVENFSPGTMAKLGLDYDSLRQRNPAIVMVSGSVYGQTGPLAPEWGIDGTGGALSGRTFLTGWPDQDPVIPGAVPYGDVIVPYVMAGAVAAALQVRDHTGGGAHIDASMYEICVQQMHDAMLKAQQGDAPRRMGNQDAEHFHQGVYPVQGEDRWLAIELPTAADWQRLRSLAHLPEATDAAARDALIAEWTRAQAGGELAMRLQAEGFAAGELLDMEDLFERDPQLLARGALTPIEHALLGRFGHIRTPISFSDHVPDPYRAPNMGEHSQRIAAELCGLSPQRIAELDALGVFR